jgi:hypothetical protein
VLVKDSAAPNPAQLFGSFFVLRELEQNVRAFHKAEQDLATELGLAVMAFNSELAAQFSSPGRRGRQPDFPFGDPVGPNAPGLDQVVGQGSRPRSGARSSETSHRRRSPTRRRRP